MRAVSLDEPQGLANVMGESPLPPSTSAPGQHQTRASAAPAEPESSERTGTCDIPDLAARAAGGFLANSGFRFSERRCFQLPPNPPSESRFNLAPLILNWQTCLRMRPLMTPKPPAFKLRATFLALAGASAQVAQGASRMSQPIPRSRAALAAGPEAFVFLAGSPHLPADSAVYSSLATNVTTLTYRDQSLANVTVSAGTFNPLQVDGPGCDVRQELLYCWG
ncbi:hypothetical protein BDK51DRAFT_37542 [Blyttiomyces helicus]|uniref:Uncharacterized protein n=1 Tax=Blyttiomyces helicus TaxID=388810 RepID=A0A4V1ISJ8_9FUNG|nr:hypothetical protein BDK51DRAFT_37542 [Blyttiomyces helicus]|eukprot:RKO93807.1 hypothetical protein BDK51DRAFT_37542 [Blyttiomyces helicus]